VLVSERSRAGALRPGARDRLRDRARRRHAAGSNAATGATGSAYAVLINVPGAQSSGTQTSPAGSYCTATFVSVHAYTAGTAISGAHAYGHSELTGVSLLGGS